MSLEDKLQQASGAAKEVLGGKLLVIKALKQKVQ